MRGLRPALALLLLAGCGQEDRGTNVVADANQIERLSTPKVEQEDLATSARLQPLSIADLQSEGLGEPGCAFRSGGRLLLVSVGSDSLARIGGRLRHFVHSAPVGESGGFFEDRQVSISVGRTDSEEPGFGERPASPARITVTNRRTEQQVETTGEWRCGG